jgi:NAD(P)-dependent dehydrogenase (short-subunit alcohol dehydrogenase family)
MTTQPEPYRVDLLAGQHILVTGGGTGLGAAMAARCGSLGAAVTVCGRRRAPLDETVAALREAGGQAEGLPCDVRKSDVVEATIDDAEQRQGPITMLLNNAAGNFLAHSHTLEDKGFDAIVDINLRGGFHVMRACGRRWIERGSGGSILSIVTTYAETGACFVLPSAASKAGIVAMTRSLAVEWGRHGIRLNAIAPGPIPTKGAWDRLVPGADFEEKMKASIPLQRFATKDDLSTLAVFLLSDALSFGISGQVVDLDGAAKWACGASFNELAQLPEEQLTATFDAMRPRRPKS